MRPIRVTGVTGNSVPIPLDVYSTAPFDYVNFITGAAPTLQVTMDDVFNITNPNWVAPPTAVNANGQYAIPRGTRAVRGQGMIAGDVLVVSPGGLT